MNSSLHFANGNAKLKMIWIFSLPAGWSCPFASKCQSRSDRETGKIQDGEAAEFRCYAASGEAIYPKLRALLWRNWEVLRGKSALDMAQIIEENLPSRMRRQTYRIHSHGDFFNQDYFDAWAEVARRYPKIRFYAYTKALPFWVKRLDSIPRNFVLTASKGGTHDHLIEKHKLKFAEVVFDASEAKKKKMKIDHDDSLAMSLLARPFALLLHGTQPACSIAARAWQYLKKNKLSGYSA